MLQLPSGSRLDGVKTENTAPAVVALAYNSSVDSSESVSIHPRIGNSVYSANFCVRKRHSARKQIPHTEPTEYTENKFIEYKSDII